MAVVGIMLALTVFSVNSVANIQKNKRIYSQSDAYLYSIKSPLPFSYEEGLLYDLSIQYNIDYFLAWKIINCESGWSQYASNPSSSADSYWQFLDSTWRNTMIRMKLPVNTDKFELPHSLKAGAWLLSNDGLRHWNQSKNCWQSY